MNLQTQGGRRLAAVGAKSLFVLLWSIAAFNCVCTLAFSEVPVQTVHALLVIMDDDMHIAASVGKNRQRMHDMLDLLPRTDIDTWRADRRRDEGNALKPVHLLDWVRQRDVGAQDTILVYYSGHGHTDYNNRHYLDLKKNNSGYSLLRSDLTDALQAKRCQLKMLITDACGNLVESTPTVAVSKVVDLGVDVDPSERRYVKDLFLAHEGFLDITAASPGEFGLATSDIGGLFTTALVKLSFTEAADVNRDRFLSWDEVFTKCKTETQELFQQTLPDIRFSAVYGKLENIGQMSQVPHRYAPLPTQMHKSAGSRQVEDVETTATLNIISTPSGATVQIDGVSIGKTPLAGYEVDTGTLERKVTLGLAHKGYKSHVDSLTLVSGQIKELEITLELDRIETLATLKVTSTPSGATVYLDGNPIGPTPLHGFKVNTGVHGEKQVTVALELSGYKTRVINLTLQGGQTFPWDVTLDPIPLTISSIAILDITSEPSGGNVYIDNAHVGNTPLRKYQVDVGPRLTKQIVILIRHEGYQAVNKTLTLRAGQTTPWHVRLIRTGPPKRITDNNGATMVLIPAGQFQMGSNDDEAQNDEQPVHTVHIDAFFMDEHEVTNVDYKAFLLENPAWQKSRIDERFHTGGYLKHWSGNNYPSGKANHPVTFVSWYAAMAYAEWAGKRLPTEAEWEYAARGGLAGQKYPSGNTLSIREANYKNHVGDTTAVGRYAANGYGLYDMAGNVWEWCLDAYDADFYFVSRNSRNPISGARTIQWLLDNFTGIPTNNSRVLRGGSWSVSATGLRVAGRFGNTPAGSVGDLGFRCARGTVTP